jgi:hypothetical protein
MAMNSGQSMLQAEAGQMTTNRVRRRSMSRKKDSTSLVTRTHGGKRAGAGRPPALSTGSVTTTVSVVFSESELEEVDKAAKAKNFSRSSYIRMKLGFPVIQRKPKARP